MKFHSYTNTKKIFILLLCVVLTGVVTSCKKYLDKKPTQSLAVPSTVKDLRAVLDNTLANVVSPEFTEYTADNFYVQSSVFNGMPEEMRKLYVWDANARITVSTSVWTNPYLVIYQANFVLDLLPKIQIAQNEQSEAANIKGTALFYRSFMFERLAQLFCRPYSATAATDLGLVIKTNPSVDEPVTRSTVQKTYEQIIADFTQAADLLPEKQSVNTRPNKAAAYGALARVYLSMRDYPNAELYADKSLSSYNTLLDYNTLTPSASPQLPSNPLDNPEILFLSGHSLSGLFTANPNAMPDTLLYQSYAANDLRKIVFYANNGKVFHGSYHTYTGPYSIFDGIATDEVMLIRAEARVRNGNVAGGLVDLNTLLRKRWNPSFTDITATGQADALDKVLMERRKELAFRGLRWSDLRRFNLEGANITLKRILDNVTYTLPPNDPRWVLLIPDIEIGRSGIAQNPR